MDRDFRESSNLRNSDANSPRREYTPRYFRHNGSLLPLSCHPMPPPERRVPSTPKLSGPSEEIRGTLIGKNSAFCQEGFISPVQVKGISEGAHFEGRPRGGCTNPQNSSPFSFRCNESLRVKGFKSRTSVDLIEPDILNSGMPEELSVVDGLSFPLDTVDTCGVVLAGVPQFQFSSEFLLTRRAYQE